MCASLYKLFVKNDGKGSLGRPVPKNNRIIFILSQ